jgi:TonB family protein
MEQDAHHSRARTREAITVSTVVHLLIFLWLALNRAGAGELAGLTEITFVEETDPNGLPDAAPPMARKTESSAPVQQVSTRAAREDKEAEHFTRALERGDNAPRPQSTRAVTDILNERLDAIDKNGSSTTRIASLVPAPNVGIPAPAGLPGPGDTPNGVPSTLTRSSGPGSGGGTAPVALTRRVSQPAPRPVMAAAMVDEPVAKPATATHSGGSRNLAGANLVGPVADRAVTHYKVPDYPDWAKRDGTEGSVTLYFFVLPDGRVKENVLVEQTSGFSDFDDRAVAALLQWKFVSLPLSNEQWGRITFNYRLSGTQ